MDYSLGSSSEFPNYIDTSYDVPVYDGAVTDDIATQSQDVSSFGVNDQWSGFFKTTASALFDYALKKDAAETGIELQRAQQTQYTGQPASAGQNYAPAVQAGGLQISTSTLMIAGFVAALLILNKG